MPLAADALAVIAVVAATVSGFSESTTAGFGSILIDVFNIGGAFALLATLGGAIV
jgi:hypothetical protein